MDKIKMVLLFDEEIPIRDLAYESNYIDIIPIIIDKDMSLNSIEVSDIIYNHEYIPWIIETAKRYPNSHGINICKPEDRYYQARCYACCGNIFREYTEEGKVYTLTGYCIDDRIKEQEANI